jgi:thymidylate synthase
MIDVFEGGTADEVWQQAIHRLQEEGEIGEHLGRGGNTREILHAMFVLTDPRQRWILSRQPAINPAFAIAEVVWILRGRNDAAFLNYWNSQLPTYAGTGDIYHGAYGFRLRQHFGIDQLTAAYETLQHNPTSRQVVLQIWDTIADLPNQRGEARNPDIPCNVVAFLKIRNQRLEWMQVMRSNDIFRGVPYNIIQWTSLQEILAGWLGIEPGTYTHFSDSLHWYTKDTVTANINKSNIMFRNSEILSYSKEISDRAFIKIESALENMMDNTLTAKQLLILSNQKDIPVSFRNLLLIVASEAARKRKWIDITETIMNDCSNPMLIQAWLHWKAKSRVSI